MCTRQLAGSPPDDKTISSLRHLYLEIVSKHCGRRRPQPDRETELLLRLFLHCDAMVDVA